MTLLNVTFFALTIAYPFIVYLTLGHLEPRILVLILLIVYGTRYLLIRRRSSGSNSPFTAWIFFGLASFAVVVFAMNSGATLLYYPVLINVLLFVLFGYSLIHPPSVIEQIARMREPDLPASGVAYTRKVTIAWQVFFVVNGSVALATAMLGNVSVWSLYNGFVAYLLMGAMFAVEYLIRRRVRAS
jgi:uncharacterized membrane protein